MKRFLNEEGSLDKQTDRMKLKAQEEKMLNRESVDKCNHSIKSRLLADQALKIIPAKVEYFARYNRSHIREYNHQKSENKMGKLQQQGEFEF